MPDNIPILCMVCSQTLKGDAAYAKHMEQHGGSVATGKAIEQNIPKIPVGKDIPPSDEFMELAKQIDSKPSHPLPMPPTEESSLKGASLDAQPEGKKLESKPLRVKYKYEGNCPECGKPVDTLEVIIADKCAVIAWCALHSQVGFQTLDPIYKDEPEVKWPPEYLEEQNASVDKFNKEQEVKSNGTKDRFELLADAPILDTVRSRRMRKADKKSSVHNTG